MSWKMDALQLKRAAPINKLPKKEIIRSLKNLAKKRADSVIIAAASTKGRLIGSDALSCIQEVLAQRPCRAPATRRSRRKEITHAFDNLVEAST